jgi:hypothetical protein
MTDEHSATTPGANDQIDGNGMAKCPNCGEAVGGQKFCPHCGSKLAAADAEVSVAAESPTSGEVDRAASVRTAAKAASSVLAQLPYQRYVAAAVQGLIVYAATWVVAALASLLLLIGVSSSGGMAINWGWLFSAPGQLVGVAFGGELTLSAAILGATANLSVFVLPLILTATSIVGVAIVSRRDEGRTPTPSRGTRWLLSTAVGLVLAVVAILVSWIFPLSADFGGTGISTLVSTHIVLSTASGTLFVGALILGTLVSYIARARVAAKRLPAGTSPSGGLLRGAIAQTAPLVGLYLSVMGALIAVAVIIGVVIEGSGMALWSALLWLPTVVADGIAFINFSTISLGGSATLLPGTAGFPTAIWMPGSFPVWLTLVVVVVNLVVIASLGVLLYLRRNGKPMSSGLKWGTTTISFAVVGAALSLVAGVAAWSQLNTASLGGLLDGALGSNSTTSGLSGLGAAGSSALDSYASLSLFVGPAAWTFLIFGIVGALVELSSIYVAPALLPLVPAGALTRVEAVLSRVGVSLAGMSKVTATSEPFSPQRRRRIRVVSIITGGAVVLIILIAIAVSVVSSTVFGPQVQVKGYLDALVARDASSAAAVDGLTTSDASAALLSDKALRSSATGTSSYSILSVRTSGDTALVTTHQIENGRSFDETYSLHRAGSTGLVFPVWRLDPVNLPSVDVQFSSGISSLLVNGVTVPLSAAQQKAGSISLPAFPGTYTVSLGDGSKWVTARARTIVADSPDLSGTDPVTLTVRPSVALTKAVTSQVSSFLQSCVNQAVLEPNGCPFEEFSFGQDSDVVWSIATQPAFSLSQSDDGAWEISTDNPGRATVTYNEDFYGVTAESDYDDFYISGTVTFVDGQPKFTYTSDY